MANHKLNDDDDRFVQVPADAVLMFAGAGGTETWIERDHDTTVRIIAKAVGIAIGEGGTLEMCIEVKDGVARGQDGPASPDSRLRASQSVQVVVKAGERLAFKAYPRATHAALLRTVVSAAEVRPLAPEPEAGKEPPPAKDQGNQQNQPHQG